jgi:hypothetical protein
MKLFIFRDSGDRIQDSEYGKGLFAYNSEFWLPEEF